MNVLQWEVLMTIHPILLLNSGHWVWINESCNKPTYCLRVHFLSSFKTSKGLQVVQVAFGWLLGIGKPWFSPLSRQDAELCWVSNKHNCQIIWHNLHKIVQVRVTKFALSLFHEKCLKYRTWIMQCFRLFSNLKHTLEL